MSGEYYSDQQPVGNIILTSWRRSALLLGILYLAFQAFPIIFEEVHGFNVQSTGLAFLGIGVGMFIALVSQPYWNSVFRRKALKHNGHPPPEVRLLIAQVGGLLAPIGPSCSSLTCPTTAHGGSGLYVMAFTTYKHVHWIGPIIGSIPFGTGTCFIFTGVFTYLVTAYRPIAASAMAANSAMRSTFAAVFPLFAAQMYHRLGTVGATALLAGLMTLMIPLPCVIIPLSAWNELLILGSDSSFTKSVQGFVRSRGMRRHKACSLFT